MAGNSNPDIYSDPGTGPGCSTPNYIDPSISVQAEPQYGVIDYTAVEFNALTWSETGRPGEVKNLYMGVGADFLDIA